MSPSRLRWGTPNPTRAELPAPGPSAAHGEEGKALPPPPPGRAGLPRCRPATVSALQRLEPAPHSHLVLITPAPSLFRVSVIICVAKLHFFVSPSQNAGLGTPLLGPRPCVSSDSPGMLQPSPSHLLHRSRAIWLRKLLLCPVPAGTELAEGCPSVCLSTRASTIPMGLGVLRCCSITGLEDTTLLLLFLLLFLLLSP